MSRTIALYDNNSHKVKSWNNIRSVECEGGQTIMVKLVADRPINIPVAVINLPLGWRVDDVEEVDGEQTKALDLFHMREKLEHVTRERDALRSHEHLADVTRIRDACQVCKGWRGGVPGNENIVRGVTMCDYCSATVDDLARLGLMPPVEVALKAGK